MSILLVFKIYKLTGGLYRGSSNHQNALKGEGNTVKLMSSKLRNEVWLVVAFGSGKKWHKALKRIKKSTSNNLDEINLTYVPYNEVNLEKLDEYPEIENFIVNNKIG